ncbi:uncharacterized protein J4E88_001133 [Alternaria novae-zelandiae]|uniref:uncharacterized protein n=1 Tax=Alternaria novae-zelandiae TaxID=430562 RepID=UPI0020C31F3C|nr:uncharacterized protein J4E88_001133 [Alternaria novae-zelandiae]KAI4692765.1 hypothetical protein J4E88_001133 [Alternaria novae-zelandiae]
MATTTQPDMSEAEKYFWESLPPELRRMVCDYLPQYAISRRLRVALRNRWDDEVALFEGYLYKKPYLRIDSATAYRFEGLSAGSLAKFQDLLVHVTPEAGRRSLRIMKNLNTLLDTPGTKPELRTLAFTNESRVTAQTEALCLRLLQRYLPNLDTICIPTWYDGEKSRGNLFWGSLPHLLQKWDFFHPKNDEELEDIELHNEAAAGDSKDSSEFNPLVRIPKLIETTGSPIMLFRMRKENGKEVEILVNRDAPAHYCRRLLKECKGNKILSIVIDNGRDGDPVPLIHIIRGIGWRTRLKCLEELSGTHVDLAQIDVKKHFLAKAMTSLQIRDCAGVSSFLNQCHSALVDLTSLIFKESGREIEQEEETALCTIIESCNNLQTLCLIYDKARPIIEGTTTPSFWESSISKIDQPEYCHFPLASILPSIGHSLTSLHLGADPSLRLHTKDLAFIATQCTNLASLGIPFPALTEDITPDQFRQEISDLGVLRDLLLLQYLHLSCPLAEPDEDDELPPVEDIARCALEMLLNEWILTHVKYFTVAFRTATFTCDTCHFRVLSYTNTLERISEKKLGRNMEAFGHFVRGDWDEMAF